MAMVTPFRSLLPAMLVFILVTEGLIFCFHQLYGDNIKMEQAAEAGDLPTVQRLIQAHPALVSSRYYIGNHWTPLHVASLRGYTRMAAFLLAHGAEANARDKAGSTAILYAALGGHQDVVDLLRAHGAAFTLQDAAALGDGAAVRTMIEANPALVDGEDSSGATALYWAAQAGHLDVVQLLVAHQAEVNSRNRGDATPLIGAAGSGRDQVVEFLLDHGADVNARTVGGETALHSAVWMNRREVVRILLAHQANAQLRNNDGQTPLNLALESHHGAVATMLIQHGDR
jgi:ankyrin repeat protein